MITVQGVVVGNYQFTPSSVSFTGGWGADRRTLTFQPSVAIQLNTAVTWTLNPAGANAPLKSAAGQPLATVTGGYRIASNSGGSPSETCAPAAPGSYVVTKFIQYIQAAPDTVLPVSANSASFAASVLSPSTGPAVTNGSLVLPDNTTKAFITQPGGYRLNQSFSTETALDAAYPAGNYTLRFVQTGEPERVIPMTVPTTPTVIPKIENFAEAQAIDATKDFTLRWNAYSPQGPGAIVRVVITDEFGNRIFLAPNQCVPRVLDPAATSVVIPANYLRPGFNYQGQLIFTINYYNSATDVPQMTGNGFVQRSTLFSIRAARGPGVSNELCDPGTFVLGSYAVSKLFGHRQISATEVVPQIPNPAFFSTVVQAPPGGPAVTNGSLTLPGGANQPLTNQAGFFTFSAPSDTEAALDTAYPAGEYTLRFNQTGQPERIIAMAMPTTPATIPQITNYDEAQAIDPSGEFSLSWNAFNPQGPGAFIRLIITDELGQLTFMAPNPCVPRTLDPTATSVVVPTNYFRPGGIYLGQLVFGLNFYASTTDVPQMSGYGAVQRATSFPLKARGGSGGGTNTIARAVFTSFRILPNGHPELNLAGTAGKNYSIQRAGGIPTSNWSPLGLVTMSASGTGVFEDTDATLSFPVFYRAVGDQAQ
jgi:hypothetical protein